MKPYQPIDCNFYDYLEAQAVRRVINTIIIQDENGEQTITARIDDFFIKKEASGKVEYMKLDNGQEIRLDTIISVNNQVLLGFCSI